MNKWKRKYQEISNMFDSEYGLVTIFPRCNHETTRLLSLSLHECVPVSECRRLHPATVNTHCSAVSRLECYSHRGAGWPSGLGDLTGDRTVNGSSPAAVKTFRFASLRNFGNPVYPALPVSFKIQDTRYKNLYLKSSFKQ